MSKSDWLLLGSNALLLLWMFLGFASTDLDMLMVGSLLAMAVAALNGGALIRRSRTHRARYELADAGPEFDLENDLDVHRVLDIDQRLEALERAESRRLRQLAEAGVLSGPGAPLDPTGDILPTRQRA